jgi:proline iminopeptidase
MVGHFGTTGYANPSGMRNLRPRHPVSNIHEVGDFETSDNVRLRYHVRGSGPPLLACQGGPGNISDTLADVLVPLEDAYTLAYHDYRGSGRSAVAPSATNTYERIADDLDELRVHLGYERVGLLAHSMGGFIGLNYGLRHPECSAGLVLVGTTPTGVPGKIAVPALRALGPTRTAKILGFAAWYVTAWSWRSESKGKLAARSAAMDVTQEGIPAVRDKVKAAMAGLPFPNDNVPQLERMFARTDLTGRLNEIRCPALVLYGQRDAVMVAGGQMLMQGLTNVRGIRLPHVGHEPSIEDPDAAFPSVLEFLATLQY